MPAALRASSSASGNGPEGAHVQFLLKMASSTGSKIARRDVRRSCKFCYTSNQDADCATVTLSARQISRRKGRATSRIAHRGIMPAESQAMQARYGSATVLTATCQVCGRTSTWPQQANVKNSQSVPLSDSTPSKQQPLLHTNVSAGHTESRLVKGGSQSKSAPTPKAATAPDVPNVAGKLQDPDIVDRTPPGTKIDAAATKPPSLSVNQAQEGIEADQAPQSISLEPPPDASMAAKDTAMQQSEPPCGKHTDNMHLTDMLQQGCSTGLQSTTLVASNALKKKKKQKTKQHKGVGVRLDFQGATPLGVGSVKTAADGLHEQAHRSRPAEFEKQPSSYMYKLRAKLQSTKKVHRNSEAARVKKKQKQRP